MVEAVAFFAVGTWAFYALLAAAVIGIFAALDRHSWAGALIVVTVVLVTLGIWGEGVTAAKWLFHNPSYALGGLGVYVAAGAIWGVSRWWVEVRKLARECRELYVKTRKDFLKSNQSELAHDDIISDNTPIPANLRKKWAETRVPHRHWKLEFVNGSVTPPQASEYKPEILTWMAFWPMSLVWTILDDFVKELYENIYQYLAASLQRISDKAFADLIKQQKTDAEVNGSAESPINPPSGSHIDNPPQNIYHLDDGGGITRG